MQLGDYVKIIDGFFIKDYIKLFLRICKTFDYKSAEIVRNSTNVIDKNTRDVEQASLIHTRNNHTKINWTNYFRVNFFKLINNVYREGASHCNINRILDMMILKYNKGGFYKVHTDHGALTPRTLTIVIFLNDDYEGGELEIFSPDEKNSKIIEPKMGRIVMFPSNFLYPHKAHPVEKGTKYSIVSWLI